MTPLATRGTKPLTSSAFYVLLALADAPRHGLGIIEEVEARTGGAVTFGPGTLYNTIRKLEDAGHIEESDRRPRPALDDPRRRYYRITRSGRSLVRAEAARLDLLLRVARDKDLLPSLSTS